jgi:hypothetical protein
MTGGLPSGGGMRTGRGRAPGQRECGSFRRGGSDGSGGGATGGEPAPLKDATKGIMLVMSFRTPRRRLSSPGHHFCDGRRCVV